MPSGSSCIYFKKSHPLLEKSVACGAIFLEYPSALNNCAGPRVVYNCLADGEASNHFCANILSIIRVH